MKRFHITLGATTSNGGVVVSASSPCSVAGVKLALEGDRIACPVCRTEGRIEARGARISEACNGREAALQDDVCACKCVPAPRLVANQSHKFQWVDAGGGTAVSTAPPRVDRRNVQAASGAAIVWPSKATLHGALPLRFFDVKRHAAIAEQAYRLEFPYKVIEGVTDSDGFTQIIEAADRAVLMAWQIAGEHGKA